MEDQIFTLGTYDGTYPTTPATGNKTAYDWVIAILGGANNILGSLFPTGINNSGTTTGGYYPGQYSNTQSTSSNNTLIYVLIGLAVLYFLTKDKK